MIRTARYLVLACLPGLGLGCLEPPEEEIPLSAIFAPPGTTIDSADVEDIEQVAPVGFDPAALTRNVAYLRGYADGEPVWYWNVDGANADFIAPVYEVRKPDGALVGRPIIEALPGQPGYTPWWRVYVSETTDAYADEVIWSREALDAAVAEGLLTAPTPTRDVVNAPVAARGTTAEAGTEPPLVASTVWYQQRRAHWLRFPGAYQTADSTTRKMPIFPVYVLQRIDEAGALYEFLTQVDIDGDNALDNSNNVFAAGPGNPRYSPLWAAYLVRVSSDYPSIDTTDTATAVGITSEAQLIDRADPAHMRYVVSSSVALLPLVNCPIQTGAYPP